MTIYEQLQNYCDCIELDDEHLRTYVDEVVNLISIATCWTEKPCDTFLFGERKEIVDLGECENCPIVFRPKYVPFDEASFTFTLVEREGTAESSTVLTDVTFSADGESFLIDPSLPSCDCKIKCGCGVTYYLIVTYDAGYEEIPECMLPVFCSLLGVIKNKERCDCEACQDCGDEDSSGVTYPSGDLMSASLDTYLGQMLNEQFKRQLGMLSVCTYDPRVIWGVTV